MLLNLKETLFSLRRYLNYYCLSTLQHISLYQYSLFNIFYREYLLHAKELKPWHLPILHNLISIKIDTITTDKLIQLLSKEALHFAKDKNFGKLLLLLIKMNVKFSEQQKNVLWEITNINQTLFKRPVQNILKTI